MKGYFIIAGKGKNVIETIKKLAKTFRGTSIQIVDLIEFYNTDADFRMAVRRLLAGTKKRSKKI